MKDGGHSLPDVGAERLITVDKTKHCRHPESVGAPLS
jgi:hypothetical protein